MSHPIPPEVQAHIATGITWLWSQYGQKFVEKMTGRAVDEANWRWSIEKYYTSLFERVGFVRILGRMESEPLENIFTHVNVLDKLSAERRYDVMQLMAEFSPRDFSWTERVNRISGDKAVADFPKLFILGKPGAGKTTFLKYTALRAINREIKKVPIFVTLKELSDSGMEIVPFIVHQFKVHRFPEPEVFVERLLKDGNAIVLFDGLDEVNLEDNKRAHMIQALNDFVFQYSDCPILATCRVAATDYSFTQFEYVEMADFDARQMSRYIGMWFVGDEVKRTSCRRALLQDRANRAVRELAQVPLLLALLCLVYDERGEFPPNRDEIYDEATRALLVKWDNNRNITRDVTVYKQLSLKHKQNMLARIAAETFEAGEYFLPEKKVVELINTYLQGVPGLEEPDGELVLKAMEAQHGIFVERARSIHSFSHLTLQEYFTARYIVDNKQVAVKQLMCHVGDDRWREVFKLTAVILVDATEFFEHYLEAIPALLNNDSQLLDLLSGVAQKSTQLPMLYHPSALRAFLLALLQVPRNPTPIIFDYALTRIRSQAKTLTRDLARDLARAPVFDLAHELDLARAIIRDRDLTRALVLARSLTLNRAIQVAEDLNMADFKAELAALSLPKKADDLETWRPFVEAFIAVLDKYQDDWNPYQRIAVTDEDSTLSANLSKEQIEVWTRYLDANYLLVECLKLAYVPDRTAVEDQLLLPPA